jgi:hypothetical protein
VCVPGTKNLIVSLACASVRPANALSQNANDAASASPISALVFFDFSMPLIGAFCPLAMPQIMKFASATCPKISPMERTCGVGLNAYMSSGTCAAAFVRKPFTASLKLRTLPIV